MRRAAAMANVSAKAIVTDWLRGKATPPAAHADTVPPTESDKGSLSNVMELIASFPTDSNYLTDMNFLNKLVWPIAMKDVLQHDAFTCVEFDQPPCQAMPYPVSVDRPAGNHVGQVFDDQDNPRMGDIDRFIKNREVPKKCRRKSEWKFG